MPTHKRFTAVRTAVVAATTAAAALLAVVPAAATPAAATLTVTAAPSRAVVEQALTPAAAQIRTVAFTAPAAATAAAATASAAVAARPAAARATAMKFALSKLGAAYRWGATGPNSFDCSGLMLWAFKNAGITLPRTSRAQATVGTPVAKNALQPGDLVFFYRPVSHVAMYIGDGLVVHASTAGQPVKISKLSAMPFNSARRI